MSQTVRIDCQYILSRVRVSVRSSNFCIPEKHSKPRGNLVASACVSLNDPATGHECQWNRRKGALTPSCLGATDPSNLNGDDSLCMRASKFTCSRLCARVCACAFVHACMSVCLRDVFALYDNNILPRLIMIIIKIIILYFIQIRHTDDFSSTGTQLVLYKS